VAEVAHTLGIPRARVQRELVLAGVGLRSNHHRPPAASAQHSPMPGSSGCT
jgi:hypothetical protein